MKRMCEAPFCRGSNDATNYLFSIPVLADPQAKNPILNHTEAVDTPKRGRLLLSSAPTIGRQYIS